MEGDCAHNPEDWNKSNSKSSQMKMCPTDRFSAQYVIILLCDCVKDD